MPVIRQITQENVVTVLTSARKPVLSADFYCAKSTSPKGIITSLDID